jgi:hypothetical protein
MSGRTILKLVFPAACLICLAAGYASAGLWIALPAVLPAGSAWLSACKWRSAFFPALGLASSVGLAAAGSLLSVPPAWMMLAATFALASWDAILFRQLPAGAWPAETFRLHEARHFRSLASALGIGLAAAAAGPLLSIRISFWWMMLLAALALAGLEGLRRGLGEQDK